MPAELGELIHRDVEQIRTLGWESFAKKRRGKGDLSDLDELDGHPAQRLLKLYKHRGVPVKLATPRWSRDKVMDALRRGAHKSCQGHIDFLNEEIMDMIQKGQ